MEAALALFREGRLDEAIEALGTEVRSQPLDPRRRTFLFELLCFGGDFARAEKQLEALGGRDSGTEMGADFYRSLLRAHREREKLFASSPPAAGFVASALGAQVNARSFSSCVNEDSRLANYFELYIGAKYLQIPFTEINRVAIAQPATLRDLLWLPASVVMKGDMTEQPVHLPALAPLSWQHADPAVRLGRVSVLEDDGHELAVPYGTRLLLCDDEEISILDVRTLVFAAA
jgi:type VI secretion system protein ImpE